MTSDERIKALAAKKTKQIMKDRKIKGKKRSLQPPTKPKSIKKGKRNKIVSS